VQNSHDAAVLDFWVRSKKSATLISSMYVATNEGHPAAYKLHTTNPNLRPRDVIQLAVDGERSSCSTDCGTKGVQLR
jgi:hypothetical protein